MVLRNLLFYHHFSELLTVSSRLWSLQTVMTFDARLNRVHVSGCNILGTEFSDQSELMISDMLRIANLLKH